MKVSNEVVNEPKNVDTVTHLDPLGSPAGEGELLGHSAGSTNKKPPARAACPASTLPVFLRLLLCVQRTHSPVHDAHTTGGLCYTAVAIWPATARTIWLGYSVRRGFWERIFPFSFFPPGREKPIHLALPSAFFPYLFLLPGRQT